MKKFILVTTLTFFLSWNIFSQNTPISQRQVREFGIKLDKFEYNDTLKPFSQLTKDEKKKQYKKYRSHNDFYKERVKAHLKTITIAEVSKNKNLNGIAIGNQVESEIAAKQGKSLKADDRINVIWDSIMHIRADRMAVCFINRTRIFPTFNYRVWLDNPYSIALKKSDFPKFLKNDSSVNYTFSTADNIAAASEGFYKFMYGRENWSLLNAVAIHGSASQTNIYTEVGSNFIGPVRLSLATMVTANTDTVKTAEARNRFLNSGGNAILSMQIPVFYSSSNYATTFCSFTTRIAGDLPMLGSSINNATANINFGFEVYQDIVSKEKQFNFFALVKAGWVYGFEKSFYTNLGLQESDRRVFSFGQISFGMTLFQTMRISIIAPIYAAFGRLLRVPVQYGGQVIPYIENKN